MSSEQEKNERVTEHSVYVGTNNKRGRLNNKKRKHENITYLKYQRTGMRSFTFANYSFIGCAISF